MSNLQTARVVVIDDEPESAMPLLLGLARLGIGAAYFSGDVDQLPQKPLTGVRLVFLDLRLVSGVTSSAEKYIPQTLSILQKTVALGHRSTGIIYWTAFEDDVHVLESRMGELLPDFDPLFLLNVGKKGEFVEQYQRSTSSPSELRDRIRELLVDRHADALLWEWEQLVHDAATATVDVINELVDPAAKDDALGILAALAAASSGQQDVDSGAAVLHLFESLNPLHYDQLENRARLNTPVGRHADELRSALAKNKKKKPRESAAALNGRILTARVSASLTLVRPGDLFIPQPGKGKKCPLKRLEIGIAELADGLARYTKDADFKAIDERLNKARNRRQPDEALIEGIRDERQARSMAILDDCIPVLLEIAPMCDFAQNKRPLARLVAGFLIPEQHAGVFPDKPPYSYRLPPCVFPDLEGTWQMVLNARFSYGVRNPARRIRTLPLCRLRRTLITDIQAWYASHAARPGYVSVQ